MATPEIVGEPMLVTGTAAYGLGLDVYVPSGMTTNLLWVTCGFRYTGTGASGVIIRVDGAETALSGSSGSGSPETQRFNSQQFTNLSAGLRHVSVETSSSGYLESAFLCAVLFRNGGTGTVASLSTNPVGAGNPTATQRLAMVYWSYGSSSISTDARSLLSVDVMPDGLGSLEVVQYAGNSAASSNYYGFNVSGEVSKLGAYIIVPYAA